MLSLVPIYIIAVVDINPRRQSTKTTNKETVDAKRNNCAL